MGQVIRPGSYSTSGTYSARRQPFFLDTVVRVYGVRGVIALAVAALLAFAPLAALAWFNVFQYTSVVQSQLGPRIVVRPNQLQRDSKADEPGETGILKITCDVPTLDGWRELLRDDDPERPRASLADTCYVRHECVYLRKTGNLNLPFGLLGQPPVSVWLPAGEYEIAVVHEAPQSRSMINRRPDSFPLVTVIDSCRVPAGERTVHRIALPHYFWGPSEPIGVAGQAGNRGDPVIDMASLIRGIEDATPIPTLAGYVLSIPEPQVIHSDGHRECQADFTDLQAIPREWTREQVATLRNWLPKSDTAARTKLRDLVKNLQWRESLEGWFSYALAGIAGLVFTKWGTLAILDRHYRREVFWKSIRRCMIIVVIAALGRYFLLN